MLDFHSPVRVKGSMVSEVIGGSPRSLSRVSLLVWQWAGHVSSSNLSFLICQMGAVIASTSLPVKSLIQGLALPKC